MGAARAEGEHPVEKEAVRLLLQLASGLSLYLHPNEPSQSSVDDAMAQLPLPGQVAAHPAE